MHAWAHVHAADAHIADAHAADMHIDIAHAADAANAHAADVRMIVYACHECIAASFAE